MFVVFGLGKCIKFQYESACKGFKESSYGIARCVRTVEIIFKVKMYKNITDAIMVIVNLNQRLCSLSQRYWESNPMSGNSIMIFKYNTMKYIRHILRYLLDLVNRTVSFSCVIILPCMANRVSHMGRWVNRTCVTVKFKHYSLAIQNVPVRL